MWECFFEGEAMNRVRCETETDRAGGLFSSWLDFLVGMAIIPWWRALVWSETVSCSWLTARLLMFIRLSRWCAMRLSVEISEKIKWVALEWEVFVVCCCFYMYVLCMWLHFVLLWQITLLWITARVSERVPATRWKWKRTRSKCAFPALTYAPKVPTPTPHL